MKCPKCKSKMTKIDLRFCSTQHNFVYECPICDKEEIDERNKKIEENEIIKRNKKIAIRKRKRERLKEKNLHIN